MRKSPQPHRPRAIIASLTIILIFCPVPFPTIASVQAQTGRGLGVNPSGQVKEWPGGTKRWALVIGVDKYKDGQISALKGAANDANALAEALVRYAGFPADQVILMTTSQPDERQPTRVNLLRRLVNLASVVPKDGLLLVAFAGHGMERGGQAFLLPSDAQIADDVSFLEETALSVTRMKDRIRATGVGQVVLLLDACRNDPAGRADAPNPLTAAYTRGFNFDVRNREVTAFATLYATAIGQRAYEYTEKRQGYFTWAVVEGLKGGAANERGEVTLAGLLKFVQETVPKRIGIDLGSGKQQRPFAVVEGYRAEELVIAVSGKGPPETAKTETPSSFDPAAMEMSFWESIKDSNDPSDYQAYMDKYPQGTFAALARRRAAGTPAVTISPTTPSNSTRGRTLSVEDMYAQAERDYKDNSFDQVIALARDVLEAQPDHARAQGLLGLSYFRTGKYANAVASLVKAVALGQKVNIAIKHHHKILFDDALCEGYLTFGKDTFEFHSTNRGGHDFAVMLNKVYLVNAEADKGGRLRVKIGLQKEKKEEQKDYNFHPAAAGLVKDTSTGGGGITKVACNDCREEAQALQQLLQQVIQLPSGDGGQPGATSPSAASPTASAGESVTPTTATADQVLETYIQNVGGKASLEKLTTRMMKGSYVATSNSTTVTASVESYGKAPDKDLFILSLPNGQTAQEGFDGTIAWSKEPKGKASKQNAWQHAYKKRSTTLGFASESLVFKKVYPQLTLRGKTHVGDREAYIIEATPPEGKPDKMYFDTQTGLLIRWDIMYESPKSGTYPIESYFEDYREVDGVKMPFTIRQSMSNYQVTVKIQEIKHNLAIDDARFSMPTTK